MNNNIDKEYEEYKKQGRIWGLVPKERFSKIKFPRIERNIIDGFIEIKDVASIVSDVLDSLGINGVVPASYLSPVIPGKKLVGTAVTLRNIPERKTPTKSYIDKDFIRMATRDIYYISEPGDVIVSDFGGNLDVSNMGGQSCTVAKSCGLAGAIVNGAVRDVPTIIENDYPVWSCGKTPITGKFRIEAIEINGPVSVHNIIVRPGDLIIADDSGICAIPSDKVKEVLEEVKSIDNSEKKMRELIENNIPLDKLRSLYRNRYK